MKLLINNEKLPKPRLPPGNPAFVMHRMSVVSNKRDRELARAKFERQQARRQARRKQSRVFQIAASVLVLLIGVGIYVNANRSDSDLVVAEPTNSAAPTTPLVDGCTAAVPTRADNITFTSAPTNSTPADEIIFNTNCGEIAIETDANAPKTVGVLTFLAQNGFYDAIKCHRLTTDGIYVLQCGDPAGNGSGGPGFKFEDENLPTADSAGSAIYPRGTVAMANSGPNTNGSQFFLVYQDSPLPPNYSVWGTIKSGLDRIDAIAAAGTTSGSDGPPAQGVVINTAITRP